MESDEPTPELPDDELLAAIDRVAYVLTWEPAATFPRDPSLEFRTAAVALLDQLTRLRFQMDGGDLEELDEIDVEDPKFVVDLEDLKEFVSGFHAAGDKRRYGACAAVFDWATGFDPRE